MHTFTILTLFPEMFTTVFASSIIKHAREKKLVNIQCLNIRDFATDSYKSVDDKPYGGGLGMILRVDICDKALTFAKTMSPDKPFTILLTPQGTPCKQHVVQTLTQQKHCIFLCGHYEGVDERVRSLVDFELSLGDFIVTGGEAAVIPIIDAITRLVPGVLRSEKSHVDESFSHNLLEYPQYTRPMEFNGLSVPQVLLNGNHKEIALWRNQESIKKTKEKRRDLI